MFRVVRRGHHHGRAPRQFPQVALERVGQIAELRVGQSGREVGRPGQALTQLGRRLAVQEEQFAVLEGTGEHEVAPMGRPVARGRLLVDDDMGVDAAEAHRGDPGAQRHVPGPRLRGAQRAQARSRSGEQLVGILAADGGGQEARVHRHHGLDQSGDPGGGLGVADHRLGGADGGGRCAGVGLRTGGGERAELVGVAHRGAGAVSLEERHGPDPEPGPFVGAGQGQPVAARLGAGDASLPVGGDAPSRDRRVAAQAGRAGVLLTHQHDHAAALAGPESVGAAVVHAHLGPGEGAGLGEADDLERVDGQVDAPGDGDVEIPAQQGAAWRR